MRQQLADATGLVRWKTCQHVLEVLIGVVPIHARRLNETHDSRCTLTRTQAASEQPVVAPNGNRPDLILDPVVIHGKLSVMDEARQRLPPAQAVIERLGCRRIARHLLSLQCHPLVQRIDDGSGSLLPDGFAFICSGILDLSLDVINLAKLRQRCLGNLAFASGMQIKELAPRVRQAARLGKRFGCFLPSRCRGASCSISSATAARSASIAARLLTISVAIVSSIS